MIRYNEVSVSCAYVGCQDVMPMAGHGIFLALVTSLMKQNAFVFCFEEFRGYKGEMFLLGVCIFSILWLIIACYFVYSILSRIFFSGTKDDADPIREMFDQIQDIQRFVPPEAISRTMVVADIVLLAFDLLGFYLAYEYAYAEVSSIYYRIMFFFACFCIFITDQGLALRESFRMGAAIKKLVDKPQVLERWLSINDTSFNTLSILGRITRFTIALQLFLFAVVAHT